MGCALDRRAEPRACASQAVASVPLSVAEPHTPGGNPQLCCPHCRGKLHVGGPIWHEPIHDVKFAKKALAHLASAEGEAMYKSSKSECDLSSLAVSTRSWLAV